MPTRDQQEALARLKAMMQSALQSRRLLIQLVERVDDDKWRLRHLPGSETLAETVVGLVRYDWFFLEVVDGKSRPEMARRRPFSSRKEVMDAWRDNERRLAQWMEKLTVESAEEPVDFWHDHNKSRRKERWEVIYFRFIDQNEADLEALGRKLIELGYRNNLLQILQVPAGGGEAN